MGPGYSKYFKNCAVCDYWEGIRQVDTSSQYVTVESALSKGKCVLQGGTYNGQYRQAISSCDQWKVWTALK
jgi:hypothetical protein